VSYSKQIFYEFERRVLAMLEYHRASLERGDADASDEDRKWLGSFANGHGVNVCAGYFPIAGALGVDTEFTLASMVSGFVNTKGDDLHQIDSGSCDYVVTNYFEALPDPLKAITEWKRVLRLNGVLAMVVVNSEHEVYAIPSGPLANRSRRNCYTALTIQRYLERARFNNINIEPSGSMLRVCAERGSK